MYFYSCRVGIKVYVHPSVSESESPSLLRTLRVPLRRTASGLAQMFLLLTQFPTPGGTTGTGLIFGTPEFSLRKVVIEIILPFHEFLSKALQSDLK